jgi:hypothetical protein
MISQYIYISACWQMLPGSDWRNVVLPLSTLLWFQARGVAADAAASYLEGNSWRAGDFFWNFHQPAGMVTLSTPYPRRAYVSELDHFLPTLESLEGRDGSDPRLQDYDSLPEYPPPRYLALPVLEHAGWIEKRCGTPVTSSWRLGRNLALPPCMHPARRPHGVSPRRGGACIASAEAGVEGAERLAATGQVPEEPAPLRLCSRL